MIKSRSMRWVWHVAHTGKMELQRGHRWECHKEEAQYEDIDIDWIILRRILERETGMVWTGLTWALVKW
jgi:hypothetical protein